MSIALRLVSAGSLSTPASNGGNGTLPTPPNPAALSDPVTHVSYLDAEKFCSWRSPHDSLHYGPGVTRLPTEAEWEAASRGGKAGRVYPWGNVEMPKGVYRANYFQGEFPDTNDGLDGHIGLSPRGAYPAQTAAGLRDMVGNVWEWTSTVGGEGRVKKGGSYLCHWTYCYRYRNR